MRPKKLNQAQARALKAYRERRKAVKLCGRNGCWNRAERGAFYCATDAKAHRERMRKRRRAAKREAAR